MKNNFKQKMYITHDIAEIMKMTGLSHPTVNRFLNGQLDSLTLRNLKKLCDATGIKINLKRTGIKEPIGVFEL